MTTENESLARVRAVRLWHWRKLLEARRMAARVPHVDAQRYNADASEHLGIVQSLNDFFPLGDTAERDAERAT